MFKRSVGSLERKGPSDNTMKALYEKVERTENIDADRIRNVGWRRVTVTELNSEAVL